MPALTEWKLDVPGLSAASAVLSGSAALALVLLVGLVVPLYYKVLRLPESDRDHGLNVLKELTSLITAAFAAAKSSHTPEE